jgi:hypothetical protein
MSKRQTHPGLTSYGGYPLSLVVGWPTASAVGERIGWVSHRFSGGRAKWDGSSSCPPRLKPWATLNEDSSLITHNSSLMTHHLLLAATAMLLLVSTALAQSRVGPASRDPMSYPTEAGFRFTPGIARLFARQFAEHGLINHYNMDKSKTDEVTEKVARRLMQMFHQTDGPGQELFERYMEEQLNAQARGEQGFVPKAFSKEFADRVRPLLPAIRELGKGVAQDIRPMLPLKQQLKMAGEMMAFNAGLDAFDQMMEQWSNGQADNTADPFNDSDKEVKLDEQGQSEALKRARQRAQTEVDKGMKDDWTRYVKDAKEFYGFDVPQKATADSILRECLERADAIASDSSWQARYYRDRLWQNMITRLPNGWNHPLRRLIEQDQEDLKTQFKVIEEELKNRIDRIPTEAQRRAADQRVQSFLAGKGFQDQQSTGGAR